jgi:hypothetical protein
LKVNVCVQAGTELRESAKQQLDTAAATEKQQAARLAALLTRKVCWIEKYICISISSRLIV